MDQRVVEGHIVPHRLVFTSHAPTTEYQTVAWLPQKGGIKVNISLQVERILVYNYLLYRLNNINLVVKI